MNKIFFVLATVTLFVAGAMLYCHHSHHQLESQAKLVPWNFTLCGNGTITTQNVSLGATPAKSQINSAVLFQVASSAVSTRSMKVETFYKGIWSSTDVDNGYKYNLTAGENLTYKYPFVIQGNVPSGEYSIKFTAFDTSKNPQGCTEITYTV